MVHLLEIGTLELRGRLWDRNDAGRRLYVFMHTPSRYRSEPCYSGRSPTGFELAKGIPAQMFPVVRKRAPESQGRVRGDDLNGEIY